MSELTLDDLDYPLPPERIAQTPAARRESARLLVLDRRTGAFSDRLFHELPGLLDPGDVLVRNVSRVVPARCRSVNATGREFETLVVNPGSALEEGGLQVLLAPAKKVRAGEPLTLLENSGARSAWWLIPRKRVHEGIFICDFEGDIPQALEVCGKVPLPPYIDRPDGPDAADRERYQTVYARQEATGSVAAPTAGLHFSDAVLQALEERSVHSADVTLHVGWGTFAPIRVERLSEHQLHAEWQSIPGKTAATIKEAQAAGKRVVAIGTTSVRALEFAARETGSVRPGAGLNDLYILPGFEFKAVDAMLTNFHLPKSSLLALVGAFAGLDAIKRAYAHAVEAEYRFYSYGDAMLII